MIMPRVSIITSIFKASDFLFDFLLDVKRQTIFPESEVLLLDANEDNLDFEIIQPFLDIPNFKYHRIGKCNVYEAWNIGIDMAQSEILTNWNTDDRRAYNSLEYQVKHLEDNSDIDVCYGPVLITKNPNEKFENCNSEMMWPVFDFTIENQLKHNSPHCLPVWRKSIHERCGKFDTSYFSSADYEMWFRVFKNNGKFNKLDNIVGSYYENPVSISRNPKTLSKAVEEIDKIKKIYS